MQKRKLQIQFDISVKQKRHISKAIENKAAQIQTIRNCVDNSLHTTSSKTVQTEETDWIVYGVNCTTAQTSLRSPKLSVYGPL